MKEITETAGIAKGTLYWYFKSKDEILDAILRKFEAEFLDGLIANVGAVEGDFPTKYRAFHKFTAEFARHNKELALVFNALLRVRWIKWTPKLRYTTHGGVMIEEVRDGVHTITLNRPERKNALNTELLVASQRALENAGKERSPVVVIRGSGGSFCSGGDLGEFRDLVREGKSLDGGATILHKCVMLIRRLDSVTIAVREGVVAGAGIGISLARDLSVAAEGAVMNMAYKKVGLTPDGGVSILLPGTTGAKKSNELYFLARDVGMKQARESGLVNFVWAEAQLEAEMERLMRELNNFPTGAADPFTRLTNDAVFADLEAHLDRGRFSLSELGRSPDFGQRLEGFFTKKSGGY